MGKKGHTIRPRRWKFELSYSPVLLLGFNRPNMLQNSLKFLVDNNCKIYVAIDVPSENDFRNIEQSKQCMEVIRKYRSNLHKVRIAETHQGCYLGVSNAISWAFEFESQLVILEDDVAVDCDFLDFMTENLVRYRDVLNIHSIAGSNFVPTNYMSKPRDDHRFSYFSSSWGWGTWADRWSDYIFDLGSFPERKVSYPGKRLGTVNSFYWKMIFLQTKKGKFDAWDYRWLYSGWKRKRVNVISNKNLAINVGFGLDATHTKAEVVPWWLPNVVERYSRNSTQSQPRFVDLQADLWMKAHHYEIGVINTVKNWISFNLPFILDLRRKFLK